MSESKTQTRTSIINELLNHRVFIDFRCARAVNIYRKKNYSSKHELRIYMSDGHTDHTYSTIFDNISDARDSARLIGLLINKPSEQTEQSETIKTLITRMNEMVEQINEIKQAIKYAPCGHVYTEAEADFEATLELTEVED